MTTFLVMNTASHPKLGVVAPHPIDTLRLMGSGNSGLDPAFGGGGNRGQANARLQYYLNALTGKRALSVYNATIAGSPMQWRLDNANEARDNPGSANLLVITASSGIGAGSLVNETQAFMQWCEKYWAEGADVVLYGAQYSRDRAGDWTRWQNDCMARYDYFVQYANARLPAGRKPIRYIPVSLVFERIRVDDGLGRTPREGYFSDLYNLPQEEDAFHIGDKTAGAWIHAATLAVMLTGVQPANLPKIDEQGRSLDDDEYVYLRQVLHDVLSSYWATGLDTSDWERV